MNLSTTTVMSPIQYLVTYFKIKANYTQYGYLCKGQVFLVLLP